MTSRSSRKRKRNEGDLTEVAKAFIRVGIEDQILRALSSGSLSMVELVIEVASEIPTSKSTEIKTAALTLVRSEQVVPTFDRKLKLARRRRAR